MAQLGVRKRWVGWGCRGFQSARWSFVSKGNDVDRGKTLFLLCLSKVKMPLWNPIGRGEKKEEKKKSRPPWQTVGGRSRGATEQLQKKMWVSSQAQIVLQRAKFFFLLFFLLLWDKHGGARSINQVLQCQTQMPRCLNNYPVKLSSEWGNFRKVRQQVGGSNMFPNIEKACEDCTATRSRRRSNIYSNTSLLF